MQDMIFWNNYYEMAINRDFAVEDGDDAAVEKYEYMMDVLLQNNCSDELAAAIDWAMEEEEATGYVVSPFELVQALVLVVQLVLVLVLVLAVLQALALVQE